MARGARRTNLAHWRGRLVGLTAVVLIVLATTGGSARASVTPIGSGDLPSAVTDRDGTTHVVWLESHGAGADTIGYCRIPFGDDDLRERPASDADVRPTVASPPGGTGFPAGTATATGPR